MENLDPIDLQLLRLLQSNGKMTAKELADAVHLTTTPVFERQRRLERQGYIRRYAAVLDAERMGLGLTVFCKVKLQQMNRELHDDFARHILRLPEVTECFNTSGSYDYLLKVRTQDMAHYQQFIMQHLGNIPNVASIESTFVMSEVKQDCGLNI